MKIPSLMFTTTDWTAEVSLRSLRSIRSVFPFPRLSFESNWVWSRRLAFSMQQQKLYENFKWNITWKYLQRSNPLNSVALESVRMDSEICGIHQVVIPSNRQSLTDFFSTPCDESHNEPYCTPLAASKNKQFHFLGLKLRDGRGNHPPVRKNRFIPGQGYRDIMLKRWEASSKF